MADVRRTKEEAMAKVNAMMTALRLYPDVNNTGSGSSFNMGISPIDLLVDFFKSTKGYDWLINTVAKYIAYGLPALEVGVKGILLTNIQTMLSCSIKPIITREMIDKGVTFDLNKIDLFNMFSYSPLDKNELNPGRYYYFGCGPEDGLEILDDVKNCRDFNAVLWYAKNTPGERVVWRREIDVDKPFNINNNSSLLVNTVVGNYLFNGKQVKSNGIATIEFNHRSSVLNTSEDARMYFKEPINNCVHVFIGCCKPFTVESMDDQIVSCTRSIAQMTSLITDIERTKEEINTEAENKRIDAIQNGLDATVLKQIENDRTDDIATLYKLQGAINGYDTISTALNGVLGYELHTTHERFEIPSQFGDTSLPLKRSEKVNCMYHNTSETIYPTAKSNYYYLHPLFEWNTDFIMSMKLFDEKVVAAQLLDSLTDCLKFSGELGVNGNISLNFQAQFVQAQLRDLVTKIIETDDATVSDCFFSFTNDSYNALLNEVEMAKAGLQTMDGSTANVTPSAEDVMGAINTISAGASKEEIQSAIAGSIFSASSDTNPHDFGYIDIGVKPNALLGFTANMTILDQLLTKLAYVIVSIIMQPKVYILLMTNLELLGGEPNFDLLKFIQQFKNLISQLIKEIRDQIFEFFRKEMLQILEELIKKFAITLSFEQYQYYITLLTHCIDCFKIHKNEYDWLQDAVDYADITELTQIEDQEC